MSHETRYARKQLLMKLEDASGEPLSLLQLHCTHTFRAVLIEHDIGSIIVTVIIYIFIVFKSARSVLSSGININYFPIKNNLRGIKSVPQIQKVTFICGESAF